MMDPALRGAFDWPDRLVISEWDDPVVADHGYHATSRYVEVFWLPILGPTATWMLRRFALHLANGEPKPIGLDVLAAELGLGHGTAKNSPVGRTLSRLLSFDMATLHRDELRVRTHLMPLPARSLKRLPEHLQEVHVIWTGTSAERAGAAR